MAPSVWFPGNMLKRQSRLHGFSTTTMTTATALCNGYIALPTVTHHTGQPMILTRCKFQSCSNIWTNIMTSISYI